MFPLTILLSFLLITLFSTRLTTAAIEPPCQSNGLTDVVQWDNYTLFIYDQRIFLYSGEFHAFRLPVPDLWLDIFQKIRAAGFNAVSIYNHWGVSNPAPGYIDFDDWRNLQALFDAAKAAGLFVVFRPGPYINAETTAGGIAHWVTSQVAGELRTNASDYRAAWTPYIEKIIDFIVPNQVTNGGPVIAVQVDNEYSQLPLTHAEYFVELEAAYHQGGVVIPLTYNDPGMGSNFINGTGAVDLYGLDEYPQQFDCAQPEIWHPVMLNYHQYHEQVNPSEPFYFPEFQGGSLDGWGGSGYNGCEILTGPDFEDVFYKQNWASNSKLMSFYMFYGGTSWGLLPYPGVYTSYDYGAAIRENRMLSPKYDELKHQGLFLRSSPQFHKTDWIGDTSTGNVVVGNPSAFATLLRNPDSGTGFYITRQNDSTSTANIGFTLQVDTSIGTLTLPRTIPSIALNGRQSKVVVTDYSFGSSTLLYSTANVLFAGKIGSKDVIFFYGDSNQNHEIAFQPAGPGTATNSTFFVTRSLDETDATMDTITITAGSTGLYFLWESDTQVLLFSDAVTAATFWAPIVPHDTSSLFTNYWQFGSNETVLVGGPYLVRNATIETDTLHLWGDLNSSVPLTVLAPDQIESVLWNGVSVPVTKQNSVLTGQLTMKEFKPIPSVEIGSWKFADSLPEIQEQFSDADWILANHTTTNIIMPPSFGDGRVLYGCDYGFCEGIVLWHGHFFSNGTETAVNLSISGGTAFAASVWINDVFIRSTPGNDSTPSLTTELFEFPPHSLKIGEDNVITVVRDNNGLDETGLAPTSNDPKSPRGIAGFELITGHITTWKVQGKYGGYTRFPDKTRGILNEGGLFGEREGWHLPGFDTSSWPERSLSEGLPNNKAGVGFFVTTFTLDLPEQTDIPASFVFADNSERYRAFLFVNGWKYGKRIGNLGPQTQFPVHQGLLNYNGENTIAVALWALDENATVAPHLSLQFDGYIEGGVGPIHINNPPWTSRQLL